MANTNYKFWHTEYFPYAHTNRSGSVDSRYGNYVIARDEREANLIINLRGMDERISDSPSKLVKNRLIEKPSKAYKARKLSETLHTLSFAGNALVKSGIIEIDFLLSDTGILHEVIHELQFPEEFMFNKSVYEAIKKFDQGMIELGWLI